MAHCVPTAHVGAIVSLANVAARAAPAERGAASPGIKLATLGHACLAVYREGQNPPLMTDPWLIGSVYWRSWWLQNYPSAAEIDWRAKAARVYVTHEHPDP